MDPRWHAVREDGSDFPGDQHPISVALASGQPVHDVLMGITVPQRDCVWILVSAMPLYKGAKVSQAYVVFEDITERHQMQQQLRQLAFFDPLTQLPNRRLLTDRLNQAMTACKRGAHHGAMMFLDLDNFKPLNDQHGHEVGDLLLIEVARRLKACVREVDTVARLGGDEFVVILVDLHPEPAESALQASAVAEKIRASLAEPYVLTFKKVDGAGQVLEHRCSASIGLTLFSQRDTEHEPVFQRADDAMYQAKELGRNRVHSLAANRPDGGAAHRRSFSHARWPVQQGCKQRFALIQALSWRVAKSQMEPLHRDMFATTGSRFGVGSPFGTLACAWVTGHHRIGL